MGKGLFSDLTPCQQHDSKTHGSIGCCSRFALWSKRGFLSGRRVSLQSDITLSDAESSAKPWFQHGLLQVPTNCLGRRDVINPGIRNEERTSRHVGYPAVTCRKGNYRSGKCFVDRVCHALPAITMAIRLTHPCVSNGFRRHCRGSSSRVTNIRSHVILFKNLEP